MSKIRSIIIDDEEPGRFYLSELIKAYCPDVAIVGEANSVKSGIGLIDSEVPELVFLDIRMGDGTGFDVLDRVSPNHSFAVVFTTAFNDFAIRAIKRSAFDYLVKPVSKEELTSCIQRYKSVSQNETAFSESISQLRSQVKQDKVALPTLEGLTFVETKNIVRFKADGSYTEVWLTDGKMIMLSKNLKEIESITEGAGFCRIHKSHVVNLRHIDRYNKTLGGTLEMSDGAILDVSRRRKREFLDLWKEL